MRDAYPAALIQTAVLARERKALIYGSGHLQRKQLLSNFEMDIWQAQTLVSLLERSGPGRVFVILPHSRLADMQPNAALWPAPSLAVIRGTVLGAVDVARYWADSPSTRFTLRDGDHLPIPRQQWRSLRAEDQFDAVLYLGQPSAMTTIEWSPALCADAEYIKDRLERIALAGLPNRSRSAERVLRRRQALTSSRARSAAHHGQARRVREALPPPEGRRPGPRRQHGDSRYRVRAGLRMGESWRRPLSPAAT
jgi:hypothetical protein